MLWGLQSTTSNDWFSSQLTGIPLHWSRTERAACQAPTAVAGAATGNLLPRCVAEPPVLSFGRTATTSLPASSQQRQQEHKEKPPCWFLKGPSAASGLQSLLSLFNLSNVSCVSSRNWDVETTHIFILSHMNIHCSELWKAESTYSACLAAARLSSVWAWELCLFGSVNKSLDKDMGCTLKSESGRNNTEWWARPNYASQWCLLPWGKLKKACKRI